MTNGMTFTVKPLTKDKKSLEGAPTAYVCENFACKAPTTDLNELQALLSGGEGEERQ